MAYSKYFLFFVLVSCKSLIQTKSSDPELLSSHYQVWNGGNPGVSGFYFHFQVLTSDSIKVEEVRVNDQLLSVELTSYTNDTLNIICYYKNRRQTRAQGDGFQKEGELKTPEHGKIIVSNNKKRFNIQVPSFNISDHIFYP